MIDPGAVAEQVVAGLLVLMFGGAGVLLFRFLSRRISVLGRLWRRISKVRGVPRFLFLIRIGSMFLGFVLPSDGMGSGGLFLVAASGLYALIFREPRQREVQQHAVAPHDVSEFAPSQTRASNTRAPRVTPAPDTSANPIYNVGYTLSLESGGSLTVRSFESPVPTPEYMEPDSGKEYSAIEVEWCAGPSREEELEDVRPSSFELQMPDNTRYSSDVVARDPDLPYTMLLPNDCVRGWISFQTPQGVKPAFAVFTGTDSVIKWAL